MMVNMKKAYRGFQLEVEGAQLHSNHMDTNHMVWKMI